MSWNWQAALGFFLIWAIGGAVTMLAFELTALRSGNPTISQALWVFWDVAPVAYWIALWSFLAAVAMLLLHLFVRLF